MLFPLNSNYLESQENQNKNSYDSYGSNMGISSSDLFNFNKFKQTFMDLLNEKRRIHKVGTLYENYDISKIAKIHAEKLADQSNFSMGPKFYKDEKLGEIVYIISGSIPKAENVINSWYNQSKNFNWEDPQQNKGIVAHFSQMLWRDTKEVGIAFEKTSKGKYYIVANFWPCGNIQGKEKENLFRAD